MAQSHERENEIEASEFGDDDAAVSCRISVRCPRLSCPGFGSCFNDQKHLAPPEVSAAADPRVILYPGLIHSQYA